jgi:hypothetical protein
MSTVGWRDFVWLSWLCLEYDGRGLDFDTVTSNAWEV